MRALVAGWFSWELMGTTAGDIMASDVVCEWLEEAGVDYDIALAAPFKRPGSVIWNKVNPDFYTDIIFVCGPFRLTWPVPEFLDFFKGCRFTGVNLSMIQPLDEWNPFSNLYERDSSRNNNPDISLASTKPHVPVVGLLLVHKQKEYGSDGMHERANEIIAELISSINAAVVPIDTMLEYNKGGLRSPEEIESVIAKMDVVITTRLHGTVLSIKNSVPVIPLDPIRGGAKISVQVKLLKWPILFTADEVSLPALQDAYSFCLTPQARQRARECCIRGTERVDKLRKLFVSDMTARKVAAASG